MKLLDRICIAIVDRARAARDTPEARAEMVDTAVRIMRAYLQEPQLSSGSAERQAAPSRENPSFIRPFSVFRRNSMRPSRPKTRTAISISTIKATSASRSASVISDTSLLIPLSIDCRESDGEGVRAAAQGCSDHPFAARAASEARKGTSLNLPDVSQRPVFSEKLCPECSEPVIEAGPNKVCSVCDWHSSPVIVVPAGPHVAVVDCDRLSSRFPTASVTRKATKPSVSNVSVSVLSICSMEQDQCRKSPKISRS